MNYANGLVIATSQTCGPCKMAKQWLTQNGIAFTEMSLEGRPDLIDLMFKQSGQRTVPQFFMDGQWISGGFRQVQAQFGK